MLIRLVSHPTDNPLHIDKLIYIKGLPDKMMFDIKGDKRFLKEPWKIDPLDNLPRFIRDAFEPEEVYVHTPAFAAPNGEKYAAIDDKVQVHAVQLDYQNGQGEQVWKQIERMIDMSTPRDERLPSPVIIAKNRTENISIGAEEIPRIDFGQTKVEERATKANDVKGSTLRCPVCNKTFDREPQMRMHKARTGHRESMAVTA